MDPLKRKLLRVQLPSNWEEVDTHSAGYCYLKLYPYYSHQKVASIIGIYPTWSMVKEFGCFNKKSTYHVMKSRDGLVHIASGGAGVRAEHLDIPYEAILGELVYKQDKKPDFGVYQIWCLGFIAGLIGTRGNVFIAIIAGFIMSRRHRNKWEPSPDTKEHPRGKSIAELYDEMVEHELIVDQHHVVLKSITENVVRIEEVKISVRRTVTFYPGSIKVDWPLLRLAVSILPLIPLAGTSPFGDLASAKAAISATMPDRNIKFPQDFDAVHKAYADGIRTDLPMLSMCIEDEAIRRSVLHLRMPDVQKIAYVGHMCPVLPRQESWWHDVWLNSEEQIDEVWTAGNYLDEGISSLFNLAKKATTKLNNVGIGVTDRTSKVIDVFTDLTVDMVDTVIVVADEHIKVPSGVVEVFFHNIDNVAGQLPELADVISGIASKTLVGIEVVREIGEICVNRIPKAQDFVKTAFDVSDVTTGRLEATIIATDRMIGNLFEAVVDEFADAPIMTKKIISNVDSGRRIGGSLFKWIGGEIKGIYGSSWKEAVSDSVDALPWFSKRLGETVAAGPRAILDGLGIEPSKTFLNPTPLNLEGYRRAIFGDWTDTSFGGFWPGNWTWRIFVWDWSSGDISNVFALLLGGTIGGLIVALVLYVTAAQGRVVR